MRNTPLQDNLRREYETQSYRNRYRYIRTHSPVCQTPYTQKQCICSLLALRYITQRSPLQPLSPSIRLRATASMCACAPALYNTLICPCPCPCPRVCLCVRVCRSKTSTRRNTCTAIGKRHKNSTIRSIDRPASYSMCGEAK